MKILVIEDDRVKSGRLRSFLKQIYPEIIPTIERSYQTGLARVETEPFDLVLLDMTLPTFNATPARRIGRPRPLGGYEILRKMRRKNIVSKVIVVSALGGFGTGDSSFTFEELAQKCEAEFPEIFVGAVFFSQTNSKWERQLHSLVRSVLEPKND
ncbi:hypothetical protein [Parvibaculum sp.]|uniref:response regulator n=1 Tax=Parvibaculum sp. TaxID=2024848 RepID=UPI001D42E0A7|nr:hypothetical protein [Parvibaculum sp.]MBX3490325.1 hypothetical protein [Parvibaculum sp.]